jgi:capsid protein
MDFSVATGKLAAPGYFRDKLNWLRSEWQPPGMESIDPLRETKAMIDQVAARLRSPQEIAKARGRDLEAIYREIAEANEMADNLGIKAEEVSTALANNPAAVEGQKSLTIKNNGHLREALENILIPLIDDIEQKIQEVSP